MEPYRLPTEKERRYCRRIAAAMLLLSVLAAGFLLLQSPQYGLPLFWVGGTVQEPLVNLNTATLEELDALPGIGEATARNILGWRRAHGGFRTLEQLLEVPGIGEKKFSALLGYVTLEE